MSMMLPKLNVTGRTMWIELQRHAIYPCQSDAALHIVRVPAGRVNTPRLRLRNHNLASYPQASVSKGAKLHPVRNGLAEVRRGRRESRKICGSSAKEVLSLQSWQLKNGM